MSHHQRPRAADAFPAALGLLLAFRLLACSSSEDDQRPRGLGDSGITAGGGGGLGSGGGGLGSGGGGGGLGLVAVGSGGLSGADCSGINKGFGQVPGPCLQQLSATCDGDTTVTDTKPCDPRCGTDITTTRVLCHTGSVCSDGKCLTRATAPSKACTAVSDCGLPASVCADSTQMMFSDPTCEGGQCRWKQLLYGCGSGAHCEAATGECASDPARNTAGPASPHPMALDTQPAVPPEHACTRAADCTAPSPGCFGGTSVLSYVAPACVSGSCEWEVLLSQCLNQCSTATGACD